MRAISILLAVSIAFVAGTASSWAKPISNEGITVDEMAAYLVSKGYPVTPAFEKANNHHILKTTIDGVNIDVYFLDCVSDDSGRCASVQFAASWRIDSPGLEKVNAWNREKRFMRAYLTTSNTTLWAEYDMFLAPDGSTELIDQNITMVQALYRGLKTHFGF